MTKIIQLIKTKEINSKELSLDLLAIADVLSICFFFLFWIDK